MNSTAFLYSNGRCGFCRFLLNLLILCAAITDSANAQSVRLTTSDGSQVRGVLAVEAVTIQTAYGPLSIPSTEIRSIKFGLHPSSETDALGKRLGSSVFRERVEAIAALKALGRLSLPVVRSAMQSTDLEIKKAASSVYAFIVEQDTEAADAPTQDTIAAKAFTISGKIGLPAIRLRSPTLGEITVLLADCRTMTVSNNSMANQTIDAALWGSDITKWLDTGIYIEMHDSVTIKAEGQVDLWSQQPGQYLATPKGHTTIGKGGQFQAGALVGKIGHGEAFLVGERFHVRGRAGRLYLQIVPSPWNNPSEGSYRVEIKMGEQP